MNYYPPKPSEYNEKLINSLWNIYKKLQWDSTYKIGMEAFHESDKAKEHIKGWLDKGAYIFCHFTSDYSNLVIFRNDTTDKYIKEYKKEKDESAKKK